jgi:Zn-dependent protease with chaperone function
LNGLILIGAAVLAAGGTLVTNWLALIPWRRSKTKHWSEQARILYPVRTTAAANLWVVPAILILAVLLIWPETPALWAFVGMVAALGVMAGTIPMDQEIFPRIPVRALWRQAAIGCLMRFLIWFVFIGAVALMPVEFNTLAWAIGGAVLGLWVIWSRGGLVWAGRKLGLFLPAPERLRKIATDTASKMNVPFREVWLVRAPLAQAYAMPGTRELLFTERLLELLPDDEVAAICAHELAHLTESRPARYSRSVQLLMFLPWLFFNPMVHAFGQIAFLGLLANTMMVPRIYRKLSRKLESRADQMAKSNEGDAGTYARALTRLYEDGLLPAVSPKNRTTHPHLYDRILAAGVTPDFLRPAAAASMAWYGYLFTTTLGLLFAAFAIRLIMH